VSPKRRGRFSKTCFTYFTGDDKRSEAAGLAAPSGLQQSNGLNNFDRDSISSLLRELLSRRKEDFEVPPPPIFFQVGRIQKTRESAVGGSSRFQRNLWSAQSDVSQPPRRAQSPFP